MSTKLAAAAAFALFLLPPPETRGQAPDLHWRHLSTATGDLPLPSRGTQQTSLTVADFDRDGRPDFVLTERTAPDSVVLYRASASGWLRSVIDPEPLHIEAGGAVLDVDRDGDLDYVAAGDYQSHDIWWWQNPSPAIDRPWTRRHVKRSGAPKHHDQVAADFDGCGTAEVVFWNQDARGLFVAKVPPDPLTADAWPITAIYGYGNDSQPEQLGKSPGWKGINEHEGLAATDVDGDGALDIVGGGRWFRNHGGLRFDQNLVDPRYAFSRTAVGRFVEDSPRPQIALVVGDGEGPLNLYEWVKGTWVARTIADIRFGHSLQAADFDGDGHLDLFCGEQRLDGGNPGAKGYIFFGDGKGNFTTAFFAEGVDFHEAKVADLDGDGRPDVVSKPYNYQSPRVDVFLNGGPTGH